MSGQKKNRKPENLTQYDNRYEVEVARGRSHIASTRSADTRKAAIEGAWTEFVALHGPAQAPVFLELLATRLEQSKSTDAAAEVRRFARNSGERHVVNESAATTITTDSPSSSESVTSVLPLQRDAYRWAETQMHRARSELRHVRRLRQLCLAFVTHRRNRPEIGFADYAR